MDKQQLYQEKTKSQLEEMNAKANVLKAKIKKEALDSAINLNNQLDNLDQDLSSIQQKLEKITQSGKESWEDLKTDIDLSMQQAQEKINQYTQQLNQE